MNGQAQTWRQVLQQRGQHSLIGRQHEYEVFRLNFIYQVPEYLIFAISGPDGVGKTSLLTQYQAIAQEHGAITTLVNVAQLTAVPEQTILQILNELARQLTQASTQVTTFDERRRQYLDTLQMITADTAKPAGVFDFIKGLAQPETTAAWDAYLYEKSLPPDQIMLLKNPVEVLTRALIKDLTAWATIRRIVLCFDNWELLEPQIGDWLRAILAPGELNTNIWLITAGAEPPDDAWAPFRPLIAPLPLQPFTTEETHSYLSACGQSDPARQSHIWNHSRGLPLWVSLLASARGPHIEGLALNPADRYLKWLTEPWQRETVLRCAAARYLNADIVQTLTDNPEAFAWLRQTPLLNEWDAGWRYPPILQTQMRELAYQQSPATLATAHTILRDYYAQRIAAHGDTPRYRDPEWQQPQLEHLYYGLMLNDRKA
ncbi:MAG TPA: AAA family ATPase, partial [Anaerolineae bacterium]|nr:AAA family ATPase [Anaerolineae bacterium]